jgi:serine/threonine protein kinase
VPLHFAAAKGHTDVVAFLLGLCDSDQLRAKNNYGQRPVDVCLNIETMQVFERSNESSMASTSTSAGSSSNTSSGDLDGSHCDHRKDRYAGRTPYHQGSVLLRNSRIDVVQRLLQKSGKGKATELGKAEHEDLGEHEPGEGFNRGRETSSRRSSVSLSASRPRVDSDHDVAKVLSVAPSHRRRTFSTLHSEDVEVVGPDSFRLLSVLGKGSFGEVYKVVHKRSGDVYAMKVLQKSKICGRNLMRYVLTERNLLSYIQHPYIVALHYAFQTPSCLVLVQQFLSGGNLTALIKREGRLQEPMAQLYIAEIFLAIEHLHERSVVYRDLKPENVVLDEGKHAMLVDFGLCKEAVEGLQGTKSFCGSIAYLAPEILARKGHGPPVDIYGLGVLLYECLAGQPPYYCNEREKLFRNIAKAELKLPVHVSPHASALISALMCRDPSHRLGVKHGLEEIRDHAFFRGLDFNKVLRRDVPVPSTLDAAAGATASRRGKKEKERSGGGQVQNPFRGRLENQVRKQLSGAQDISGWEFARPSRSPSP